MRADHVAPPAGSPASSKCKIIGADPLLRKPASAARNSHAPKTDNRPLTKFENRDLKLGHRVWDSVFGRI
jgi:hypothetical protein